MHKRTLTWNKSPQHLNPWYEAIIQSNMHMCCTSPGLYWIFSPSANLHVLAIHTPTVVRVVYPRFPVYQISQRAPRFCPSCRSLCRQLGANLSMLIPSCEKHSLSAEPCSTKMTTVLVDFCWPPGLKMRAGEGWSGWCADWGGSQ